ncbi:SchA/CurD-like domain-containing protein [Saccharothrix longispora]|uniref:SchA/CurD-like domain-containing protein n=1 Tax=Saccharothrix longispora TaxID=33920 RepID=UPI0028FD93BC|nr:SchA/CurD-like domain-containing protein [Saccharothrix longispora]MDU0287852.1 SchA/CurD-like domain-containing protein [Saccharothrix longispora]
MNRYALTFAVRPGSEAAVAGILSGYHRPPPGASGGGPPGGGPPRTLLDRTSVFMAGPTVVRVVDITCPPAEAIRHLAGQPQIRAVEDRLRPHLLEPRDLSDEDDRRRFLATSVMRVTGRRGTAERGAPRTAALYRALPGRGREVARLLAVEVPLDGAVTVFRRHDLVVHLTESAAPGHAPGSPPVPLAGLLAPLVRLARPMTLVTDRVVEVAA